jgi:hypothetical protein
MPVILVAHDAAALRVAASRTIRVAASNRDALFEALVEAGWNASCRCGRSCGSLLRERAIDDRQEVGQGHGNHHADSYLCHIRSAAKHDEI